MYHEIYIAFPGLICTGQYYCQINGNLLAAYGQMLYVYAYLVWWQKVLTAARSHHHHRDKTNAYPHFSGSSRIQSACWEDVILSKDHGSQYLHMLSTHLLWTAKFLPFQRGFQCELCSVGFRCEKQSQLVRFSVVLVDLQHEQLYFSCQQKLVFVCGLKTECSISEGGQFLCQRNRFMRNKRCTTTTDVALANNRLQEMN